MNIEVPTKEKKMLLSRTNIRIKNVVSTIAKVVEKIIKKSNKNEN